ncbi:MAG: AMP-binding protein [Pseudomonadales bacterium]|jgi:surfactin family lipopeptide synthetase A|nr:AMP-binding protein [Pseudomonadales bacterium]
MATLSGKLNTFLQEEVSGSIVTRFRKVVMEHGQKVAIKTRHGSITYTALDELSNRLAHYMLLHMGAAKEPVALMYKHSERPIVAQLAALKALKIYCYIDEKLEQSQQQFIVSDLTARYLFCDSACEAAARSLTQANPSLTVINTDTLALYESAAPVIACSEPDDAAQIVYTSGTTGTSTGVVLPHRNILSLAKSHYFDFDLGPNDSFSNLCPLWAVSSSSEIYGALLTGCSLFPFSLNDEGIASFHQWINDQNISIITAAPALFRMLFSEGADTTLFNSVRLVKLGGDRVTTIEFDIFKQCFGALCRLRIAYGSSEFMQATQNIINKGYTFTGNVLPVGPQMDDCDVFIVDDERNEVPAGTEGEIAIRSCSLSLGYWRQPQLTNERFVQDPHAKDRRIYYTRDIGYCDSNGIFHYVGRKDSRVKVYGKMVWLTQVENAIAMIPGVKAAVVTTIDNQYRGTEIAACVISNDSSINAQSVRAAMMGVLPMEAIPAKFDFTDQMPLLLNNKLDKRKVKRRLLALFENMADEANTAGGTG